MYYFNEITTILSIGIVLSHGFILLLVIGQLAKTKGLKKMKAFLQKKYEWLGLFISLIAMSGSLYYSEIAGLAPCKLCWFQRIFIYPQLILFLVAVIKKTKETAVYSIALATIGWVIAAYHYAIQMSETARTIGESVVPCSTVGMTPSCSSYWFLKFGYITIPMMSLTTLTLLIILAIIKKNSSQSA